MSIKTQGTDLYAIDPADGSLLAVECTTSIDGVGSTRAANTIGACLDDPAARETKFPGSLTPGTISIGLNADPAVPSHVRLHELLDSGDIVKFALGWSDGPRNSDNQSTAPAEVGSDGEFDLPSSRTWLVFNGFVSAFPFGFTGNAVVTTTMTIEMENAERWIPKVGP